MEATTTSQVPHIGDPKYVVDHIRDHRECTKRNGMSRFEYLVKWFGYTLQESTWEPTENIPRHFIVNYYKRKKKPLPVDIDVAQEG